MDQAYVSDTIKKIDEKVSNMIKQIGDKSPHVAAADGVYDDCPPKWWTSGFWPGMLWLMHDVTKKDSYKEAVWNWDKKIAESFTEYPVFLHHDVGFQFLPTAVIKYELTGDQEALAIGMQAANFLAGRYNVAGEFIRAWNYDEAIGWAIVDCMMNIPLLFWATRMTKDPRYKHIAIKHADTFLKYAVRNDGSVAHILSFEPETGEFIEELGGQGNAPYSAWSRGNSWALHGLAICYRETGEQRYLDAAKQISHYFVAALPEDNVPYWDYRVENLEQAPRDSSAAAIAASGLLELADLVPELEKSMYKKAAEKMLYSLNENYATWDNPAHEAILLHGTGHKPADKNIDVSLIYGDYYFIEAFAKLNGWNNRIF
ncbi:glycoside hydrolase family 88 protein [Paenibacillus yanchengensis]|uniref:Glycoside hydrolase family 88 protein n=1 Tax=Paenibacillus yanchengensis TaxID=2035833 RepID=A0ABW4YGJ6_9BACL